MNFPLKSRIYPISLFKSILFLILTQKEAASFLIVGGAKRQALHDVDDVGDERVLGLLADVRRYVARVVVRKRDFCAADDKIHVRGA